MFSLSMVTRACGGGGGSSQQNLASVNHRFIQQMPIELLEESAILIGLKFNIFLVFRKVEAADLKPCR